MLHLPFIAAAAIGKALFAHAAGTAAVHAAAPAAHAALTHAAAAHVANAAIGKAAGLTVQHAASSGPLFGGLHIAPAVAHHATTAAANAVPNATPEWLDHAFSLFEESFLLGGAAKIVKDTPLPEEVKGIALQLLKRTPMPVPKFSAGDFGS